jgi:hypothetical protein
MMPEMFFYQYILSIIFIFCIFGVSVKKEVDALMVQSFDVPPKNKNKNTKG